MGKRFNAQTVPVQNNGQMPVSKDDVVALLCSHGMRPVKVDVQDRVGQRPSVLRVTLEEEASADKLYKALRASTTLEIGKGRDEKGRFVVTMFGAHRY